MRKLLSLATIFTLLVAVAFVFNTNNNSQQKADHSFEVEENPTRGIAGAMQYLYAKKANQITGEIDVNDVLKAQAMLGEPKDYKDPNTVEWEKMGPINVGGRTRALVIDKDNPNRLYTGGVSGGIYISDNGGLDWYEYAGNATLPNMSITSMVQAANGDLYVGTGEGFAITFSGTDGNGSSGAIGTGIYKSTDDGATFELLSETVPNPNTTGDDWAWVNDMIAHPTNANVIYAANKGGLYVTENGGDTWDLATYGDNFDLLGVGYDITIAGNGTVHTSVGSHYYRSTGTTTFDRLSGNALGQFPIGGGRKRIAVAPSDDNYVYAIVLQNNNCLDKVLQSTDGGDSWIEIAEGGSDFFAPMFNGSYCQGGYDLAFGVGSDKERVFVGGITLWDWTPNNGWKQIDNLFENPSNIYYVHADKHEVVFHPTNPDIMYVCTDGGVARSLNATQEYPTFQPINKNYNVTQFYSMGADVSGRVAAGAQDNGTQFVSFNNSSLLTSREVLGGDGGYTELSKINDNVMFAATQNGALRRSSNAGDSFSNYLDENIDCQPIAESECNSNGMVDGDPQFITPYVLWEDVGAYWGDIEFNNNPPREIAKVVVGSGNGVWATNEALDLGTIPVWYLLAEVNTGSVSAVAVSRDGSTVFAGTTNGRLYVITNFDELTNETIASSVSPPLGANPINEEPGSPINVKSTIVASGRYINGVAPSKDGKEIAVSLGNYGNTDYVYYSSNIQSNNVSFENMNGSGDSALPPMPVYDLVLDAEDENTIIAGTEFGIWVGQINGNGATWEEQNKNIGRVPVYRVRQEAIFQPFPASDDPLNFLYPRTNQCFVTYLATHGRGMFRTSHFTKDVGSDFGCQVPSLESLFQSVTGIEDANTPIGELTIAPNPMNDQTQAIVNLSNVTNLTLNIYNMQGQLVRSEVLGNQSAGQHRFNIEKGNLATGAYLVTLLSEDKDMQLSKQLIIQ